MFRDIINAPKIDISQFKTYGTDALASLVEKKLVSDAGLQAEHNLSHELRESLQSENAGKVLSYASVWLDDMMKSRSQERNELFEFIMNVLITVDQHIRLACSRLETNSGLVEQQKSQIDAIPFVPEMFGELFKLLEQSLSEWSKKEESLQNQNASLKKTGKESDATSRKLQLEKKETERALEDYRKQLKDREKELDDLRKELKVSVEGKKQVGNIEKEHRSELKSLRVEKERNIKRLEASLRAEKKKTGRLDVQVQELKQKLTDTLKTNEVDKKEFNELLKEKKMAIRNTKKNMTPTRGNYIPAERN